GIDAMVAHLKDKHMDAIYGNHLAAFMDSGKISVSAGPKMAGAIFVEVTVHGKSGHGSRPDLSINPVFATAHVLTSLTNAWAKIGRASCRGRGCGEGVARGRDDR